MKRLTGTDAVFLAMETPSWHQHVGGLTVLDPEGRDIGFDRFVDHIEERLAYAPKFRWKLKHVPFGLDRPVWVDDPDFDIRRHVRRIAVPSPGGKEELGELVGSLMSAQLNRRNPLWELWYIEGLVDGRVALFMKYHHCLLDGVAGASLATALLDLEPEPEPGTVMAPLPTPDEATAGPVPSDALLFGHGLAEMARRPIRTAGYVAGMAQKGVTMLRSFASDEGSRALLRAPKTPFNAEVGPRRRLAFASVSIDDVRRIKEAHDVKVNDVVLALVGSVLRGYLEGHDALPDAPLVSGVPVSTREEGDTSMDNQITTMFVSLATDVADPVERLLAVHESAMSAKGMTKALGARQIQSIGEVASPLLLGNAIRAAYRGGLMSRSPLRINTLVSNVPGPPIDLYACGARVTGIFPSSVILEGMGVNITVLSNRDRLDFGIQVDPDLVPDGADIADGVPAALAELLEASGLGEPTPVDDPFTVPAAAVPA
jgi:diacylglycerol O-acyltransferase / wax synthase